MLKMIPKPLTPEAFSVFGDVVDVKEAKNSFEINYGLTKRFHDLANIDVAENGGKSGFSIFEAKPVALPHAVKVMEYHPFGSQLFFPLNNAQFLVLVGPASKKLDISKLELFVTNGKQGVNYRKGVWHHYLLPLDRKGQFVVVDRIANDDNCVEFKVEEELVLVFGD